MAAIQFTTTLDFLIIMPLGPQYMRVFAITPGQFGLMVSAYAISAGISGVAAGCFLDRFDRKTALLGLYLGFAVGTLFCALAPTYHLLVAARILAGAFGGVAGSLILAIIGDVVPIERRGAAMGMVMSSFSVASICGVPLGVVLATHLSWHVPFYALAGLSVLILLAAATIMPSLRAHLEHAYDARPIARVWAIVAPPNHRLAFVFMALLTSAGFFMFPYIPAYMVANAGMTEKQLPLIYLFGGVCTLVSMNSIGRWADRAGKRRVFTLVSLSVAVPILILTNLPRVPIAAALAVTCLLWICMSGRMVPAMAMMTATVEARQRGGFMSINAAVQQFSSGLAAFIGGQILGQAPSGEMTHFPIIGVISVTCVYTCIYLARFLTHRAPAAPDDKASSGEAVMAAAE
ncbi:MAG: MFS transporter [Candidatus Hydrogenedentes bacterium]|nr:MFS transporter [Candidatus Hydrogenedentota bacterium]